MNRQIRQLGIGLMVCFAILFVQLNRLTVLDADEAQRQPEQHAGDPARLQPAAGHDHHRRRRGDRPIGPPRRGPVRAPARVPRGRPVRATSPGSSASRSAAPASRRPTTTSSPGAPLDLSLQDLGDLFVDKDRVGDVTLTVREPTCSSIAAEALGDREGSVVALDPRTARSSPWCSNPSYDPNVLADHDTDAAAEAQRLLDADPEKPLLARSYQERFFPGSTFKVVTATAGARRPARSRPTTPVVPRRAPVHAAAAPTGPIRNFGGESCGGTLFEILRVSCNTAFAEMGVDARPRADGRRRRGLRLQRPAADRPDRRRPRRSSRRSRTSRATSRRWPSPPSARTTCRPRRSRWRWWPPRWPTTARS